MDCSTFGFLNDSWILCNMFGALTELSTNHDWFSSNNVCDWNTTYLTCNNDNELINITMNVNDFSSYLYTEINTSYWPQNLRHFDIHSFYFSGNMVFDNMPKTMEHINIEYNYFTAFDTFPNVSSYSNLEYFFLSSCCNGGVSDSDSFDLSLLPYSMYKIRMASLGLTGTFDLGEAYSDQLSAGLNTIDARFNDFEDVDFSGMDGVLPGCNSIGLDDDTPCVSSYCDSDQVPASERETEVTNWCYCKSQCEESCNCQDIFGGDDSEISITNEFSVVCLLGLLCVVSTIQCLRLVSWNKNNEFGDKDKQDTKLKCFENIGGLNLKIITVIYCIIFWVLFILWIGVYSRTDDILGNIIPCFLICFGLIVLITPCLFLLMFAPEYQWFQFEKRLHLGKKVLIPKEYKDTIAQSKYGDKYTHVCTYADDTTKDQYLKIEQAPSSKFKFYNKKYHFTVSLIMGILLFLFLLVFIGILEVKWNFIYKYDIGETECKYDYDSDFVNTVTTLCDSYDYDSDTSGIEDCANYWFEYIDETSWWLYIFLILFGAYSMIVSKLAAGIIVANLIIFIYFSVNYYDLFKILIPGQFETEVQNNVLSLFGDTSTDGFDQHNLFTFWIDCAENTSDDNQVYTMRFIALYSFMFSFTWAFIFFGVVLLFLSLYLNIHKNVSKNKLCQIETTMVELYFSLSDLLSDIILIVFWLDNESLISFAWIQIVIIIANSVFTAIFLNEAKIGERLLLGIGIGNIYWMVKNPSDLVETQHKMIRLWEMIFLSFPSVALVFYLFVYIDSWTNSALFVSIFLSFANITYTALGVLKDDQIGLKLGSSSETRNSETNQDMMNREMKSVSPSADNPPMTFDGTDGNNESEANPGSAGNEETNETQQWIEDKQTGHVKFFKEEDMKDESFISEMKNKMQEMMKQLKQSGISLFVIWLYLICDLFVRIAPFFMTIVFIQNESGDTASIIVFLLLLVLLGIYQFFMFKRMLIEQDNNTLFKYFLTGLYTGSIYFFMTFGLKYLPTNAKWGDLETENFGRVIIAVIFLILLILLQVFSNVWQFEATLALVVIVIILYVAALRYVKRLVIDQ